MRKTLLVALCGLAACGRAPAAEAPGPSVPVSIAPRAVMGLDVREDRAAAKAFAKAKSSTLAADTRLFAMRQRNTLVATLQMTTVRPSVRLARRADREQIVNSVLAGAIETVRVGGVTVYASSNEDRVIFLWFGRRLFEALQVKATKLEPRALLNEILSFQTASPAWEPLPVR